MWFVRACESNCEPKMLLCSLYDDMGEPKCRQTVRASAARWRRGLNRSRRLQQLRALLSLAWQVAILRRPRPLLPARGDVLSRAALSALVRGIEFTRDPADGRKRRRFSWVCSTERKD